MPECIRSLESQVYQDRPHEALDMNTPGEYYQISKRSNPVKLPEVMYLDNDEIRNVDDRGFISYNNQKIRLGKGLRKEKVAIRTISQKHLSIYFCNKKIKDVNLE